METQLKITAVVLCFFLAQLRPNAAEIVSVNVEDITNTQTVTPIVPNLDLNPTVAPDQTPFIVHAVTTPQIRDKWDETTIKVNGVDTTTQIYVPIERTTTTTTPMTPITPSTTIITDKNREPIAGDGFLSRLFTRSNSGNIGPSLVVEVDEANNDASLKIIHLPLVRNQKNITVSKETGKEPTEIEHETEVPENHVRKSRAVGRQLRFKILDRRVVQALINAYRNIDPQRAALLQANIYRILIKVEIDEEGEWINHYRFALRDLPFTVPAGLPNIAPPIHQRKRRNVVGKEETEPKEQTEVEQQEAEQAETAEVEQEPTEVKEKTKAKRSVKGEGEGKEQGKNERTEKDDLPKKKQKRGTQKGGVEAGAGAGAEAEAEAEVEPQEPQGAEAEVEPQEPQEAEAEVEPQEAEAGEKAAIKKRAVKQEQREGEEVEVEAKEKRNKTKTQTKQREQKHRNEKEQNVEGQEQEQEQEPVEQEVKEQKRGKEKGEKASEKEVRKRSIKGGKSKQAEQEAEQEPVEPEQAEQEPVEQEQAEQEPVEQEQAVEKEGKKPKRNVEKSKNSNKNEQEVEGKQEQEEKQGKKKEKKQERQKRQVSQEKPKNEAEFVTNSPVQPNLPGQGPFNPYACDSLCAQQVALQPICASNGFCVHEFPSKCSLDTYSCKHPELGFQVTNQGQCIYTANLPRCMDLLLV